MFGSIIINKNVLRSNGLIRIMGKRTKQKASKDENLTSSKHDVSPVDVDKSNNIIISILAKPGAKQNAITSFSTDGVGVQISAPPTEGEANTELVKYIASVLAIRKSDVVLQKGFKSRVKTLKITGNINADDVKAKLLKEMQNV